MLVQEINDIRANMRTVTTHVTEDSIHRILFGFVGFVKVSTTLEDHQECVIVACLITDLQKEFQALIGERVAEANARMAASQLAANDVVKSSELDEMSTREQDQ